ncbi:hypothetical protein BDN70DRAFT_903746 [Pholiota conissans]|uniref:Uncharacterized protein n=1 Tax=Pholiota conissans TaxID=109636 RepID=A0A9P5ZB51_9AGAR|nr:hypothetical protein BDN70DRAFT_903746 [Pholiota conissans]
MAAKTAAAKRSPNKTSTGATKNTKPPKKTKQPQSTEKDESTSSYFEKADEYDSDALDDDSDAVTKKRKSTTRNSKKTSSPNKKQYDEAANASSPESAKAYDSDALDDDSDTKPKRTGRAPAKAKASPKKNGSPRKKKKVDSEEEYDDDVEEGQEVVGMVVQAPKTGRVPPGQISKNTFDFLGKLMDPKCNDREWYMQPVYRLAEKEWKDFVEAFTDLLVDVDSQVPPLPPKDVIHRIYRDVRFSNDKTPYKKNFSASFSRSGRKGIFAGLRPGNESMIAAGSWCPGRNELANIRTNLQRSSRRLRSVISAPDFVRFFGEPKPHPKGETQNIFGMEDELKVAPKGVPKDHKDIDLLKCRSFVLNALLIIRFTDSEVLSPDFKETVASVARILQPLVHCLNDMMTVVDGADEESEEDEEDGQDDD